MMNKPALSGSEFMTSATPKPRAGEHTKEPWRIGKPQGGRGLVWADGAAVADCLNGDGSDDARRIVACVNACEGISDGLLEEYGSPEKVFAAQVKHAENIKQAGVLLAQSLEAERDLLREREKALVAAIEAALAYCESEAIGTVQQEIADNERMRQTLHNALEYGR